MNKEIIDSEKDEQEFKVLYNLDNKELPDYIKIRDKLNRIIEKLRIDCKHPSYSIGRWGEARRFYTSRICDYCSMGIDGITETEKIYTRF